MKKSLVIALVLSLLTGVASANANNVISSSTSSASNLIVHSWLTRATDSDSTSPIKQVLEQRKLFLSVENLSEGQPSMSAQVIQDAAVLEVSRHLDRVSTSSTKLNIYASPDYNKTKLSLAKTGIATALKYFSDSGSIAEGTVVFFTPKSKTWAQRKWKEIIGWHGIIGKQNVYDTRSSYPCKGYEFSYTQDGLYKGIWYDCDGGLVSDKVSYAAHGVTHWFQGQYRTHYMPVWLVEGSAVFYGNMLAKGPHDPLARKIQIDSNLRKSLAKDDGTIIKLIKKYEATNLDTPGSAYPIGAMLYTVLVGRFGEDKALQLFKSFALEKDFATNFKSIYGMTPDDFYSLAAPTIRELNQLNWKK